MRSFPRHILPLRATAIVLGLSLFASCSLLIPHVRNVQVTDPNAAEELTAYDQTGSEVDITNNRFKASNRMRYYTIERKKKGCITDYHVLTQTGANPLLALDGALLVTGLAMTLSTSGDNAYNSQGELKGGSQWGPGLLFYGGLGVLVGKKKSFKKNAVLEDMITVPPHVEGKMHLYVDNVSMKLTTGSVETRNYKSVSNFRNNLSETGEMIEKKKATNTFSVESMESIDASIELNGMLSELGYIDTTNSLFRMSQKANMLHVDLVELDYNYIFGGAFSFQVTSHWAIKDNISKETILEQNYTTSSDVIANWNNKTLYRKAFINALTKAMVNFMGHEGFQYAMVDKREKFRSTVDAWPNISLTTGKYATQKLAESAKSIVTVKTKDGHGSGVVIGADGYVVTNLHVTGKQTDSLEVILADGKKLQGKVLRSNPVYDLALLKVEGLTAKPISISTDREIDLGASVFAVGTPTDVALGQTVTRGIISSKRNFGDMDFIQTDVSINRGNSGGALLDETGKLVGIVNAKIEGGGVEGVGFAVPSYYLPEALKIELN